MRVIGIIGFSIVIAIFSLSFLIGCAGMEFAPKKGVLYYHKELPEAEQALEDARKAGKDKECPKEFDAVKNVKDKAYETYWACKTKEAIEMAKDATNRAKALCKVVGKMTVKANFDFDKSKVKKADKAELNRAIDFIKKYPGNKIIIEGHTCNIGTEKYNQGLSERRAAAIKKYLVEVGGIDGTKITTVGYGELKPIASNETRESRAKNRRAEIFVLSE